jgi:hypothetical protein
LGEQQGHLFCYRLQFGGHPEGRPVEYPAPPQPWAELLELYPADQAWVAEPEAPAWRFWSEMFAFLVGVIEWSDLAASDESARKHVIASRARDIVERHALAFNLNGIPTPAMVRIPTEVGHPFRFMWATDSEACGPPIPTKWATHSDEVDLSFRQKWATLEVERRRRWIT